VDIPTETAVQIRNGPLNVFKKKGMPKGTEIRVE